MKITDMFASTYKMAVAAILPMMAGTGRRLKGQQCFEDCLIGLPSDLFYKLGPAEDDEACCAQRWSVIVDLTHMEGNLLSAGLSFASQRSFDAKQMGAIG